MFIAILQHTPPWVWATFAALTAYGVSQSRRRQVSLTRVTLVPLAMAGLSLYGVLGTFGEAPLALGAWALTLGIVLGFGRRLLTVRGATLAKAGNTLDVPGSWLPLALMLGIFTVKYVVGVSLAMHPALAADATFAASASAAYGLFAGTFLTRGLSLRQLAAGATKLQTA